MLGIMPYRLVQNIHGSCNIDIRVQRWIINGRTYTRHGSEMDHRHGLMGFEHPRHKRCVTNITHFIRKITLHTAQQC
jgi:hypothetical protein